VAKSVENQGFGLRREQHRPRLKGRLSKKARQPQVKKKLDSNTRIMYTIVAWACLMIIVVVLSYGLVESVLFRSPEPVGYFLVNVEWPFSFFAKPVSYLSLAAVALFYSGLRLWEERISKWPRVALYGLQLLGFVVAFDSAYEVIYNFMIWGALFSSFCSKVVNCTLSPDSISTVFSQIPWSLDFATKIFSAIFVISGYTVYYLRRLTRGPAV
jgi:hypothetical protein